MRRSAIFLGVVGVVAFVALTLLAAPAGAQTSGLRDPFDPLVLPGVLPGDSTAPTSPTVPDDPVVAPDPDPAPPVTDDLPTTGGNPRDWVAIAYMLIAIGTGLVAFARVNDPPPRGVSF